MLVSKGGSLPCHRSPVGVSAEQALAAPLIARLIRIEKIRKPIAVQLRHIGEILIKMFNLFAMKARIFNRGDAVALASVLG